MAGEFAKFYIRLGTLFDPKGLKDAESKIKGTDKAVGGLSSAFTKLGAMFAGGAAIYKLIGFARDSWAAYAKQEEVTARLNQALRSQNIYSDALSRSLQNLASDIQKVTTVGDEDTLALIQLGLSMGVTTDKMEQATKQAIGLSKAYGVDLNSSMKMVALAGQGEYTMLARYIPQLRTLTDETEKAALVTKLLTAGFQVAQAEGRTTSGTMKMLANRWGDIQESIVERAIPAIKLVLKWIEAAIGRVDSLIWTWDKLFRTDEITLAKKELELLNQELEAVNISMASSSRWAGQNSAEYKNAAKLADEYAAKIKLVEERLRKLTTAPKLTPPAALPPEALPGAGPTEDQLKKDAESRLKNVDGWYLSEKGIAETRFYQWLHESKIAWDEMDLAQKESTMIRVQETYQRANINMSGSFLVSIDRMKAAGMGWAQAWDGMWSSTLSGMTSNVKTFLTSSGNMFNNLRKLLDGIFKSIAVAFMDMVAKMIAKWLLLQAITGIFGGGIAMKLLGGRKEGGPIPETGPYLLHKGEEVLPADIANAIRKSPAPTLAPVAAGAGMGAEINLSQNITIGGTSETDINVIADKLSEATKNGVISAVNLAKVNYKVGQKREGESSL